MKPQKPVGWLHRLILLRPGRIRRNLARVESSQLVATTPSLWQIAVGVLRMWHRMVFRSETVGVSTTPRRPGWRARLLSPRIVRFPFLLWEGSVVPGDLSGLGSHPETLIRHVLGTHHEGEQFIYDLQILSCYAGALEELYRRLKHIVEHDTKRSRWLRDLCVYEGYHEAVFERLTTILESASRAGQANIRVEADATDNPDICFYAYLEWCARQPQSPSATWTAWRHGDLKLSTTSTQPDRLNPHRSPGDSI